MEYRINGGIFGISLTEHDLSHPPGINFMLGNMLRALHDYIVPRFIPSNGCLTIATEDFLCDAMVCAYRANALIAPMVGNAKSTNRVYSLILIESQEPASVEISSSKYRFRNSCFRCFLKTNLTVTVKINDSEFSSRWRLREERG